MTIRDFFRAVWDGKYLVVVVLVTVLAASYVYLDRQRETYEASATVQLRAADLPSDSEAGTVTVDADPDVARSPQVLRAAARALGYEGDRRTLAAGLAVTPGAEPNTVVLSARADTAEGAAATANALATAYAKHLPSVLNREIDEIEARLERLRDRYDTVRQNGNNRNDPLAEAELVTIESQYQALTAQRTTLDSIPVSGPVAQLVSPAVDAVSLSLAPASVVALAALIGLVAGVGAAFARRGLDFRVRTAHQVGELTGVPVLAEVSGVKKAERGSRSAGALPIATRTATPFTESIRELRTAVHVTLSGRDIPVVLVTAADPAAPRSFVAANLAASWALSGRRTAILQADLRRPELEALLPEPDGWSGDPDGPRPTRVPQLELVPVPNVAMDPADYLATDDFRELLDRLKERAEVIVVDAPPVLAAADATILGGYADTAVLLATVGKTDRVVLGESVERLRGNNVALAGIALCGVKGNRRTLYASVYDAVDGAPHATSTPEPPGTPEPVPTPEAASDAEPGSQAAEPDEPTGPAEPADDTDTVGVAVGAATTSGSRSRPDVPAAPQPPLRLGTEPDGSPR